MQKSIRVVTEADLEIADTITMAAYQLSSSRRAELQRYLALQPDGWHMALLDEQPVALGGIIDYGPFSYVGMVGVLPMMQRYGLGTFIMEALLAWAERRHCPAILLDASDAGANLYRKLGFVEDDKALLLSLIEPPVRYATLPKNVAELQEHEIPELIAFDTPYFGAGRACVFQRLLQEYPHRAFVSRDPAGAITGYLFVQERIIGPWVAQTSVDAECLLLATFSLPFDAGLPYAMLSPLHQSALALLQRYGFRQQRQLSHMLFGSPLLRQRAMIYGQASFALG